MAIFPNCILHPQIDSKNSHMCDICHFFNTKVNSSHALIKMQGLCGTALSIQIIPFGFEQSDHLQMQVLPGDHNLRLLIDYLSRVTYKVSGMEGWGEGKSSRHPDQISSVKQWKVWEKIIMVSKWDKIISAHVTWINSYLPLIPVTSAEIIPSHFEGIWWYKNKWIRHSAITRLTAHFTCGLVSALVLYKQRKEYSHTWHWMSLLRSGVTIQHKTQTQQ